MGDHALLSASGSGKWLVCTRAPRLEEQLPDDASDDAKDGDRAHALVEALGRHAFFGAAAPDLAGYPGEMVEAANAFVDHCKALVKAVEDAGEAYTILLERRIDYSPWAKEGFGTCDFALVTRRKAWARDFKYGKGVAVFATENSQAKLYGLGAYNDLSFAYDEIETIDVGIVQPRLDSCSSWEVSTADLLSWAEETVRPKANLAWAGEGPFVPGDHCTEYFCRARFTCRARAQERLRRVLESDGSVKKDGPLLSTQEVAELLPFLGQIASWAKALSDFARTQAVDNGVAFAGFKLVEGRSNRFLTDPKLAAVRLVANGVEKERLFSEPELIGITAMQELIGKKKFEELLGDLLFKPRGKPTLVPVSDPRPPFVVRTSADEDFN